MTTSGDDLLHPALPYDMTPRLRQAASDLSLQQYVNTATRRREETRQHVWAEAFGDGTQAARARATAARQHALDHLDLHLRSFADAAAARGVRLHVADDAEAARAACVAIAREHGCTTCVKSKSMVTEEIGLLRALEAAGVETIETDLGEYIAQLDDDAPAHIVTPIIHKSRHDVAEIFERELGESCPPEARQLTAVARRHLFEQFRAAELGITGANFLIAETGGVVVCTNEGNADLTVSLPRVLVVVTGIEKILARLDDLGAVLPVLARSATGQAITVYTTLIHGPRATGEPDGPEHVHVVLVDNGRSRLLRRDRRELLRCIRCGACLNACPVFRKAGGGHAYGAVYSGPIGAALTPRLTDPEAYPDLPRASSLCGACRDVCPVSIDIPGQLLALRADLASTPAGRQRPLANRLWRWALSGPGRYRLAQRVLRLALRRLGTRPTVDDPYDDRRWLQRGPAPLRPWTTGRDFPAPPRRSFQDWWRTRS